MRILHVVTSLAPQWGGPARVVASLTEELVASGIECRIVTTDLLKGASILQPAGVEVDVFPTTPLTALWRGHSSGLTRHLMDALPRFDLVHIHEPWNYPHFAAWRAARHRMKPYVVTIHGALQPSAVRFKAFRKAAYYRLVQRRILEGASLLYAITEGEAQHLRALGLDRPVAVIPNGVRLEEFDKLPGRGEFEQFYPAVRGKHVVLFMGRLHPIKGLDLLAKAFTRVAQQRDDVCLVIAGPDETRYRATLEYELADEVARGRVIFTGMLVGRERLAAFSRADVFVLPARSEVRGLVTLEAMACRLPVVVTQECGFPEIAGARAGIIVPFSDAGLSSAILQLVHDASLRETLGRNGRQLVERHYTWSRVAEQMLVLYRSVLEPASALA